jgi:hypothetical protein
LLLDLNDVVVDFEVMFIIVHVCVGRAVFEFFRQNSLSFVDDDGDDDDGDVDDYSKYSRVRVTTIQQI